MHTNRRVSTALSASLLVCAALACHLPTSPAAEPTSTTAPPATTTAPPTAPPESTGLPEGTHALYLAGPWDAPRLFALATDGSSTDLRVRATTGAAASRSGAWVAFPSGSPDPNAVTIVNLLDDTTRRVELTPGFAPHAMAFDTFETRLAFVEVGPPTEGGTEWGMFVVDLADGATTRFDATLEPWESMMLPGNPIGWAADEIVLQAFVPFSEASNVALSTALLPPGTASAPFERLARRDLVTDMPFSATPHLSPDASQLLFLAREPDYVPANYEPMAYDLAVNQLFTLDMASATPTLLLAATDGSALAGDAAWSPDGRQVLFAQGTYDGDTFSMLTLKLRDASGTVRDVGAVPLPPQGWLGSLHWCAPDTALLTTQADSAWQLHAVDLAAGTSTLVTSGQYVHVIGCVQ